MKKIKNSLIFKNFDKYVLYINRCAYILYKATDNIQQNKSKFVALYNFRVVRKFSDLHACKTKMKAYRENSDGRQMLCKGTRAQRAPSNCTVAWSRSKGISNHSRNYK